MFSGICKYLVIVVSDVEEEPLAAHWFLIIVDIQEKRLNILSLSSKGDYTSYVESIKIYVPGSMSF